MNKDGVLEEYPEDNGDIAAMLQDLSKCQADILIKFDESNEKNSTRIVEFNVAQKEVLNELKAFSESFKLSLSNEAPKLKKPLPSLNIPLIISSLLIILVMTFGIYSLNRLHELNNEWGMRLRDKIQEAAGLDQVINLFEQQKEAIHATGQSN